MRTSIERNYFRVMIKNRRDHRVAARSTVDVCFECLETFIINGEKTRRKRESSQFVIQRPSCIAL